jgi:ABC-type amino acid transport substrate-binding protein
MGHRCFRASSGGSEHCHPTTRRPRWQCADAIPKFSLPEMSLKSSGIICMLHPNRSKHCDSIMKFWHRFLLSAIVTANFLAPRNGLTAESTPLRVGISPVFPPLIFKEGKKVVGVEADFAEALAADLGRPIQFVELDWDDQIAALTDGRIDIIMSSMSVTRARQVRIAFSRPYLAIGQMALVRRTDTYKYATGFPVKPEGVIGVKKGTTGDFLVQQEFPHSKRKYFNSGEEAARALAKGKIDLFISDSPTISWLEGMNAETGLVAIPYTLSEEYLAWGVSKSNTQLLESANATLEKLQKSGRANAIVRRWVPNLK